MVAVPPIGALIGALVVPRTWEPGAVRVALVAVAVLGPIIALFRYAGRVRATAVAEEDELRKTRGRERDELAAALVRHEEQLRRVLATTLRVLEQNNHQAAETDRTVGALGHMTGAL